MASSNLLKKLRNKISKKKSYDIDTPCSAGHGTILLRRYDRVPSTYGDGHIDRQNILRDFAPPAPKQSPGRFRGEMTLPRHFRFKTNHHRTQSNVTVVDHEDIDLYNAIGDHRRSSCSCTCTTPRKIMSPITPPNGTMHLSPHVAIPSMGTLGKGRNAAKDPLPPIVKAKREVEMEKEQERLKHEGKFDVAQEEVPRYTGIDDYSNVDFQSPPGCDSNMPVQVPASTMMAPRSRHVENPEQSHRARDTLPPHVKPQAPRAPTSQTAKNAQLTKETQEIQLPKQKAMANGHPEKTSPRKHIQSVHEGQRQQNHRKDPELIDVIDCYYNNDETSLPTNDLPIPHESCINKDRKVSQPVQCETANRSQDEVDGLSMLSCSAPSGSMMHCQSSLDDLSHPRHYPQNSGHHEYKEAHQLLRATSVGKIDSLQDLEVSSSVEDLYAHVPKGTAKTPDMDDMDSVVSDPNTDNEDSLPPPPIPSRNYRSTDNCCSTAAQLGAGGCSCSHLKDMETGEELLEDGPQSVIHQQPRSTKEADDEVKQVVEPIHMTLEEVWQDACARGIPMEKPSTMTLQRRPKSTAVVNSASTGSPTAGTDGKQSKDNKIKDTDTTEDTATQSTAAALAAAKKKEKFKLKNIFKKTDHDHSPSKSPTPGHRRTLSTPAVVTTTTDDAHNCSDPLNTSGETSSSELSESVGNTSNCSSADSGVDDVSAHPPEPPRTINADFIDSLRKLKDCGWYWGPLSWDGAEARLDNKPDGSFLVRDSSDDRYILSISFRSQGTTHHTRIEHYKGTFSFFSQPKSHGAGTIIEFIEKAMEHSRSGKFLYFLRPRAPGFPPAPVQLLYPVSRFRVMQSLQHMCRFEILRNTRYDHIDRLPLPQKVKTYLRESQYYTEYILEYQGGDFMPL